jgi:hypothetical protein
MRYVLVGNGGLPIPPPGWGANEILIWDTYLLLTEQGHDVKIVNTSDLKQAIYEIEIFSPHIVHVYAERFFDILLGLNCYKKYITPQAVEMPLLKHPRIADCDVIFIAVSEVVYEKYKEVGVKNIKLVPNGANENVFNFKEICSIPDRSIYLAAITDRKCQYKYQSISSIDFVGIYLDGDRFPVIHPHYLGHWQKPKVYNELTNYANLVLLSESECHSFAVCEALMAGLGLVVSEAAAVNLDTTNPWITVVPNEKLNDIDYIENALRENRKVSIINRKHIREYALSNFSLKSRLSLIYS